MTVLTSLLNATASVETVSRASDGQGGWTVSYAAAGTVACQLSPATGREAVVADQEEQQITHVLYTATLTTSTGATLARGCRVTVDGITVEVLGVKEPRTADQHYEIVCLERQGGG